VTRHSVIYHRLRLNSMDDERLAEIEENLRIVNTNDWESHDLGKYRSCAFTDLEELIAEVRKLRSSIMNMESLFLENI